MEIDKNLLLQFMGSVSMLKIQAMDTIEAYEYDEYAFDEDVEKEMGLLQKRIKNTEKILKEIDDKYFK